VTTVARALNLGPGSCFDRHRTNPSDATSAVIQHGLSLVNAPALIGLPAPYLRPQAIEG